MDTSDPNNQNGRLFCTATPNLGHSDEASTLDAATLATLNNETADSSKHISRYSAIWASLRRDSWLWEVIACVAAAAGVVVTVVLLLYYNGKPLPSWPLGIMLGTLISVLATTIRASLSVPLSSGLGQLAWIKFRHQSRPLAQIETFDAASRGVIGGLKLMALGVGGFSGFLGVFVTLLAFAIGPFIQLALNFRESSGVALLRRCQNLPWDPAAIVNFANISVAMQNTKETAVSGDYYPSFANNRYVQALNTDCDTGNCKWDPFSSLGYCANCRNVTEHVLITCTQDTEAQPSCSYKLPNGQIISNKDIVRTFNGTSSLNITSSLDVILSRSLAYKDWNSKTTLTFFSLLKLKGVSDPLATDQVINYTLYENVQRNSFYHTPLQPVNYTSLPNNTYAALQPPQSQWATFGLETSTNFVIDFNSWLLFLSPIQEVFQSIGPLTLDWESFWNGIFVPANAVLRSACPEIDSARGVEQNLGLVVDVRWPWLALPASLVLFTTIFLCIVAIDGHKHGVPVWKTRALVHHVVGLPHDVRSSLPQKNVENMSNMKQWAERVEVRLEFNESSVAGESDEGQRLLP